MDESTQYISQLSFGQPIEYKGAKLYPVTCHDYCFFKIAQECLTVNQTAEKSLKLINLPYMEYLYEKALRNKDFKTYFSLLIGILRLVFCTTRINFKYEKHTLYLEIAQKINPDNPSEDDSNYARFCFTSLEFEEIRRIIMMQNDVVNEIIDPQWEEQLKAAQSKLASTRPDGDYLDFEDKIVAVGCLLHKMPNEIENMPIRTLDRYYKYLIDKDEYNRNRLAELQGTTFKHKLTHWLHHYRAAGKYDNVISTNSNDWLNKF